jgi:hypothetical protein
MAIEENVYKEEKEKQKKWLIKKGFKNIIGTATSSRSPVRHNIMHLEKYNNSLALNYKFRGENKTKWVAGKDFKSF